MQGLFQDRFTEDDSTTLASPRFAFVEEVILELELELERRYRRDLSGNLRKLRSDGVGRRGTVVVAANRSDGYMVGGRIDFAVAAVLLLLNFPTRSARPSAHRESHARRVRHFVVVVDGSSVPAC